MKHSFEKYCTEPEKIENYEKALADNFKGWHCHHRLQTWTSDGERRLIDITMEELKALDMYYNRPAEELIFMTDEEHGMLHNKGKHIREDNPFYGKRHSEKTRKQMSVAHKGKPGPNKGKHLSEEWKNKIGEASRGNTATKGMHWYNNGKINKVCYECPDGFVPGMLKIK